MKRKILAYALLGLGCFNIPSSLAIVTHTLTYNTNSGSTGSLTGTFEFDDTAVQYGSFQTNGGDLPTWVSSLTLTYTPESGPAQNFVTSDFAAIRFVKNTETPDLDANLVPQFTDISFISKSSASPSAGGVFEMNFDENEYTLASTPSPIPFLSFFPIFLLTRKLKKLKNYQL